MSSNLKVELILDRIKDQLNRDKIKLWLPPYKNEEGQNQETLINELAESYSNKLQIDKVLCAIALKELQDHSIDRIKQNEIFRETGLATLKVKVSGPTSRLFCVQIHLTDSTEALSVKVAEKLNISEQRIKLIAKGKVLKSSLMLQSQGITNGMQIMAVILAENPQELIDNESRLNAVKNTKEDLEMLASCSNVRDNYYLQVEDQSGKRLNLPMAERKALVTAMGLHEKGRFALKNNDYALALINLLEADIEFSNCTSELLKCVDNYGLLHLDIAWCYLCLGSASQIPDAEARLKDCEAKLNQSYGANLERLLAVKGTTGNEAALFVRLHLLQGIVLFHLNKPAEAKKLFEKVEAELKSLKVDDDSFSTLLELGLTPVEARLGLRATSGNVNAAAEFIHKKRQEREEMNKKNLQAEKLEREKAILGLCADGKQYVEPNFVNQMVTMGFSRLMAIAALKHSNNIISLAVQILQEQPHLLKASLDLSKNKNFIKQIVAMGFDPRMARAALSHNQMDLDKAVAELLACGGVIEGVNMDDIDFSDNEEYAAKKRCQEKKKKKAFKRFSEGISDNADDHLDLLLTQEEEFLKQYMLLLN